MRDPPLSHLPLKPLSRSLPLSCSYRNQTNSQYEVEWYGDFPALRGTVAALKPFFMFPVVTARVRIPSVSNFSGVLEKVLTCDVKSYFRKLRKRQKFVIAEVGNRHVLIAKVAALPQHTLKSSGATQEVACYYPPLSKRYQTLNLEI